MPRISCSNVIHIPSAIQPARLMYESTRDFISTPPPPLSFYQHLFHTPTLTYPTPCRLFNPSSSSRACTEPPLLCLNAYVGFYRTQSKQSRARDSEREKRGERESSAETERERERAWERESAIVINVEHAHCLRTARLPATSSIATQKPAKGKFKRQEEAEEGNWSEEGEREREWVSEWERASQRKREREEGESRAKGSPC